jgi:hypothetical protein
MLGASSSNSSLTGSTVAIFRIASVVSDITSVLSGFAAPSATPAAADVAVPSTTYRTWLALVCEEPNTSDTPNGSNSFATIPGSHCGATGPPPGPPTPDSSKVPLIN